MTREEIQALVLSGDGWSVRLGAGEEQVLGRGTDLPHPIPHVATARHHARVRHTPAGYLVEDLLSTSGTYLNGRLVREPQLLADGDRLQVGAFQIRVALKGRG